MSLKKKSHNINKEEYKNHLINTNAIDLFDISDNDIGIPEKAKIFLSYECETCSEKTSEQFIRLQGGNKVCLDL